VLGNISQPLKLTAQLFTYKFYHKGTVDVQSVVANTKQTYSSHNSSVVVLQIWQVFNKLTEIDARLWSRGILLTYLSSYAYAHTFGHGWHCAI